MLQMKQNQDRFRYSRTVIILPGILLFLFLTANSSSADFVEGTRKALGFAIVASLLIGCLFLPSGFISKPSPYIWKAIGGLSFFYLSILIFFLYLNKQQALHIIHTYFDPALSSHNYNQVSYAQDCRIYAPQKQDPWSNINHSFFDLFAVAHALGWFFKTLVCRDLKLVLFSSVAFQLVQYALRDTLNNFKECWWDHVFVDILGCNLIGIVLGFCYINKFNLQRYNWSLRTAPMQHSLWQNFNIFWRNWNLRSLQTRAFTTTKKFLQMTWFVLLIQINDLSIFFLKYIYQIPTQNNMILFRTVFVGFLCVNASKQYYRFVSEKQKQIKINCFMVNMIVLTEWFIIYKHGTNDFRHAFIGPLGIFFMVLLFTLFIVLFSKILISDIIYLKNRFSKKKIFSQFSIFTGITQNKIKSVQQSAKSQLEQKDCNPLRLKQF